MASLVQSSPVDGSSQATTLALLATVDGDDSAPGSICALNTSDGTTLWKADNITATRTHAVGDVVVVAADTRPIYGQDTKISLLRGFSLSNGSLLWQRSSRKHGGDGILGVDLARACDMDCTLPCDLVAAGPFGAISPSSGEQPITHACCVSKKLNPMAWFEYWHRNRNSLNNGFEFCFVRQGWRYTTYRQDTTRPVVKRPRWSRAGSVRNEKSILSSKWFDRRNSIICIVANGPKGGLQLQLTKNRGCDLHVETGYFVDQATAAGRSRAGGRSQSAAQNGEGTLRAEACASIAGVPPDVLWQTPLPKGDTGGSAPWAKIVVIEKRLQDPPIVLL
jgi:hypothetical protein